MAKDEAPDPAAIRKRYEALTEEEKNKYAVCLKYGFDVPASEVVPILESLSEVRMLLKEIVNAKPARLKAVVCAAEKYLGESK